MKRTLTRRRMLKLTGASVAAGAIAPRFAFTADSAAPDYSHGAICSEPTCSRVGMKVLADGGNAIDAIVAAALTAGVVAVPSCGIGGYGGHMMIALADGKIFKAIDFNTTAPAAARPDMYPLDATGKVVGRVNDHGWLASGVPGTLAGLQLALERYGSRTFREMVAPAIALARDGFPVTTGLATSARNAAPTFRKDAGSARLMLPNGEPPKAGDTFRNPDLAAMLQTLADRNSADSFYRGDIAQRIAEGFAKNGGLVTAKDLAGYHAKEMTPLDLPWRGLTFRTAPLSAGGLTVLQVLATLKALKWDKLPEGSDKTYARLEALRVAWRDRLNLLGDPNFAKVPVGRLLSADYAAQTAAEVEKSVRDRHPIPIKVTSRDQTGTVHLSCTDRQGNMAALTLTHGNGFGACVTVDGLGLILGHGMSRFEPQPGHPNSVAPGKRPLDNMCPTVVFREGRPVLALGGSGGRRIPNSVLDVLINATVLDQPLKDSVTAPRLNTEGDLVLTLEAKWPAAEQEFFKTLGFTVKAGPGATISAVTFDPNTGQIGAAWR